MAFIPFLNAVNYAVDSAKYEGIFLKVKQLKVLEALYLGKDTIAILPTGYGKSVIFHLLPFIFDYRDRKDTKNSMIIVVIPINALFEDQRKALRSRGIQVSILQSNYRVETEDIDDDAETEDNFAVIHQTFGERCNSKILFAHPEAFISSRDGRRVLLSNDYQERVVACVIDEAHLVQEWGIDFREDFSRLSELRAIFPRAPFLAMTATAPESKRKAITKSLTLEDPYIVIGNLNRENIFLLKEKRKPNSVGLQSYESILLPIARDLKAKLISYPLTFIFLPLQYCGYAYKLFSKVLKEAAYYPPGCKTIPENRLFAQYHAPQTKMMKEQLLRQLTKKSSQKVRVLFATVAIGIGVNIPDVRQVIHIGVPRTVESYFQEIGRAGRDGQPSKALLYYNGSDIATNVPGMTPEMREYCHVDYGCLREAILKHMGSPSIEQEISQRDPHTCCSNCVKRCSCDCCIAKYSSNCK